MVNQTEKHWRDHESRLVWCATDARCMGTLHWKSQCQKEIWRHNMTSIDIGIDASDREDIARALQGLLATTYTLYLQTHNFHWNVTGPQFRELHLMFEEHYTEMATAVDEIAERIRTLGVQAPGTYAAFAKLSAIDEVDGVPAAADMVTILLKGHEQIVRSCREVLELSSDADDESTSALVSDRMRVHEKTAWMLRATLA
jgi:starvation-inducible DNA-binding protein